MAVEEPEIEKAVDDSSNSGTQDSEAERVKKTSDKTRADPFGDETNAQVRYRTLEWWQAAVIMIAETISLGILSLPSVYAAIGMVPGILLTLGLGLVATYTGYVYWEFKMRYPHVHNMADVGEVFAGAIGREIGGAAQTALLVFIMGSHILTWTDAMNTITGHATCSIVWGVVGMVILWLMTMPRTLRNISYFSITAFISIVAAVLITMIGLGIQQPNPTVQATTTIAFVSAFNSVTNIIFAYGGHVAFFTFISELKHPQDFPKALYALQICDITLYIVVGAVIYRYAGPTVASPALGSTTGVLPKIAYGIALPTIMVANVINGHVAAKYIYLRLFRDTPHLHSRSALATGSWLLITLALWLLAWIVAESIPVFNNLLSLISALFASWFTYGLAGFMWLWMNWGEWGRDWRKGGLAVVNLGILAMGGAICGVGLWTSGTAIREESGTGSWTCAA